MRQNLHTHTTFCDGENTPEELVQAALSLGMDSLGFSGHSPLPSDDSWTMTAEGVQRYRAEVERLQKAYGGQLQIFLGLEQDCDSPSPSAPYDYLIGSVHRLTKDDVSFYVDESAASFSRAVETLYSGDYLAAAEAYYDKAARLPRWNSRQIAGHLDLITKYNEGDRLFSTDSPRYRAAAVEAVRQLARRDMVFEVNTGAMARGCRTAPYPAPALLREIRQTGGAIVITSDCHSASQLLYAFDEAAALCRSCGFRETLVLTEAGFVPQPL